MSGPEIITLGCRLNTFESEVMRGHARDAGLDNAVIVNTCAVTAEAERQARQTIRRLKRENPGARIIVTGCAVQAAPERFAAMAEVDQVLGNTEKMIAAAWTVDPATDPVQVSDIMTVQDTAPHLVAGFESRTRAFVQVQQGCDHRCTFCIVPFTRGPGRTLPIAQVIDQVRTLVENGYAEVVLTGVDLASVDGGTGALTRAVLDAVPQLPRLRLTTLDPAVMDDEVFRLLAEEPRLMPHIHLSLQSADDMVLKRMKRRHGVAEALAWVKRARDARPDVVFGADLIAGFPTETDEMAANTEAAVAEMGIAWLHVFPYSPRPGTPAARMPQVPVAVRKDRAARLRAQGAAALTDWLAGQVGREAEVLVEEPGRGRSAHYAPVTLDDRVEPGTIRRVRIGRADEQMLYAEDHG